MKASAVLIGSRCERLDEVGQAQDVAAEGEAGGDAEEAEAGGFEFVGDSGRGGVGEREFGVDRFDVGAFDDFALRVADQLGGVGAELFGADEGAGGAGVDLHGERAVAGGGGDGDCRIRRDTGGCRRSS